MSQFDHPRTIQIFLPNGDPTGIRIAEVTATVLKAFEVPRSLTNDFFTLPEAKQLALYCLFNEDDNGDPQAYIGQTSNLKKRLSTHDSEKSFWDKAIIFVSSTNLFTKNELLYLEALAIEKACLAQRYTLTNGNKGSKTHISESTKADYDRLFGLIEVLTGTLGFPLFKPLIDRESSNKINRNDELLFYCKGSEAKGVGKYTNEGFIILKDSIIASKPQSSFLGKPHSVRLREKLIANNTIQEIEGKLTITKDCLFNSPSAASSILLGVSSNGWREWKTQEGKTLDAVQRSHIDEGVVEKT